MKTLTFDGKHTAVRTDRLEAVVCFDGLDEFGIEDLMLTEKIGASISDWMHETTRKIVAALRILGMVLLKALCGIIFLGGVYWALFVAVPWVAAQI